MTHKALTPCVTHQALTPCVTHQAPTPCVTHQALTPGCVCRLVPSSSLRSNRCEDAFFMPRAQIAYTCRHDREAEREAACVGEVDKQGIMLSPPAPPPHSSHLPCSSPCNHHQLKVQ